MTSILNGNQKAECMPHIIKDIQSLLQSVSMKRINKKANLSLNSHKKHCNINKKEKYTENLENFGKLLK